MRVRTAGRRLSAVAAACRHCALLACVLLAPRALLAQTNSGALDLLFPIGARSVAMGAAFVAEQGSEAVWWNPAGLARLARPDFAVDHFETIFTKGDAISFIVPRAPVGVFAVSARLFDNGLIVGQDSAGNPTADQLNRSIVLGGTFSAAFGTALDAGITYHYYRGENGDQTFATSAIDAGLQVRPLPGVPLRLGIELRNLGLSVQVHDKPQADALPTRLHVGASYDPSFNGLPKEIGARLTAEVVTDSKFKDPEFHVGSQLSYASGSSRLIARAGYNVQQSESIIGGPALGIGLATGRVQLDLSRIFESFSSGLGTPPTYISIRVGL
jgi:hypothetical protein